MRRHSLRHLRFYWLLALAILPPTCAHAVDPNRALTQCQHRIWQFQQGLPRGTIYCVLQGDDGYLWIGTQVGLVRFDGVRFSTPPAAGESPVFGAWITALAPDHQHGLWVGTHDAGVFRIQRGTPRQYTTRDGLPDNDVQCLLATGDGVWVCTSSGLAHIVNDRTDVYHVEQGLASNDIRAACETADGKIWLSGTDNRLSVWNGSGFAVQQLKSLPAGASVNALVAARDGSLWAASSAGLVRIKDGEERRFTVTDGLADNNVLCLASGQNGDLWVGTKDGFSRVRDGAVDSYRARDGLSQSTVTALCEDREGSVWVGTKHGLNQFLDRRTVPFTASEGLASNDTGPVLQDAAGTVWIGTLGAGLNRFDGHQFFTLTTQDGLASDSIRTLADDGAGGIWVGTSGGLNRLRDGKVVQTVTHADGLPADAVQSLYRDRAGTLWVGTSGGLACLNGSRFTIPPGASKSIAPVVAFGETSAGELLIATQGGGLFSVQGGTVHERRFPGSNLNEVNEIYTDGEGRLWLGTLGGGLCLLDGDRLVSISVKSGLFDDDIYSIVADDQDRLWMGCSKGIFFVTRSELLQFAAGKINRVNSTPFSPTDAQRTIECKSGVEPAAWAARNRWPWFSTIRGVIVIDLTHLQSRATMPPVMIEEFIVDGKTEDPHSVTALDPGRKNVEIRYTALSFVSPTRLGFRYRLEGFDADWIDAGQRREAFYTNLPPGSYRCLVSARNGDGPWGEAQSVTFRIPPHLYQRPWVIAAGLLLLGLIAAWIYRRRIHRIRAQLQLVLVERGRIARELHDTLLQGFSGVTMEMQALSTRLPESTERGTLDEIIRDAAVCMREARRSVAGLRDTTGRPAGFATLVAEVARRMTQGKSPRLRLKLADGIGARSPDVEENLLRIMQEAISNALRHAAARTIEVHLTEAADGVSLSVSDDGAGFHANGDQALLAGHYGILGMKERAAQIGATLTVTSAPGEGTRVRVIVPASTGARHSPVMQ